uniref:Sialomucin core protein 24-like isoform X2 n=1 Tax=Petromyzon marinus TaxID=7757 RepID=A0AAJ7UA27_PETMA|nr:sialomucin core protein 24-like isoform X2 [Petromyzon marinus]
MRTRGSSAFAWALLAVVLTASDSHGVGAGASSSVPPATTADASTAFVPNVTVARTTGNGTLAPPTANVTHSAKPSPANSTVPPSTAGPQNASTAASSVIPTNATNGTTASPAAFSTAPVHASSTAAAAGGVVPSDGSVRSFDAVSFVGGVVLAVAVQALLFFAFKYFRTRNPRYQHLGDTDAII